MSSIVNDLRNVCKMSSVDEIKLKRSKIIILIKKRVEWFLHVSRSVVPFICSSGTDKLAIGYPQPSSSVTELQTLETMNPSLGGVINGNTGKASLR